MDDKLVQYHDGELSEGEVAEVEAGFARNPQRLKVLAEIEQLDEAVRNALRTRGPTPEQVEQGKAELKALLRKQERHRQHRRWLGMAALAASAAACVMIFWHAKPAPTIGIVWYAPERDVAGARKHQPLLLSSSVRAQHGRTYVEITDLATMRLEEGGVLHVGERPDTFELNAGILSVETSAAVAIRAGPVPYVVEIGPEASVLIRIAGDFVHLDQRRGTSKVSDGQTQHVVEAPATLRLPVPAGPAHSE